MVDKNKIYIISPSDLSYICYHCAYLKNNYGLFNSSISAGITSTLDGIEKNYFLGSCKKISQELPEGQVIDPYNQVFFSKVLIDNEGRKFRIKGKCDAIIKFVDGKSGIIDFKTSKFKKDESKKTDAFKPEDLKKKVDEYNPQLHCYSLLYSNLETDREFLKTTSRAKKEDSIIKSIDDRLDKIKNVSIDEAKFLGIVFIYPEDVLEGNKLGVYFSYKYEPLKVDMKNFMNLITKYLGILDQNDPPPIPEECGGGKGMKKCLSHSFFFDLEKLKKIEKLN